MRLVQRVTVENIFRDDPGVRAPACLQVGVRQLDLRLAQRLIKAGIDAELDQLDERGQIRHGQYEGLQPVDCPHPVVFEQGGVGDHVEAPEGALHPALPHQLEGECDHVVATTRINGQHARQGGPGVMVLCRRQLHSGQREEKVQRLGAAVLRFEVVGRGLHERGGLPDVAKFLCGPRGRDPRVGIDPVQRSQLDDGLRGAAVVAAQAPQFRHLLQVRLRIRREPLPRGDLGQLPKRMFVVGFGLERLLVQRRGFRKHAVGQQMIGNPGELGDRLVNVPGFQVEIAERIDRGHIARLILDQAHVCFGGSVELSLAEQLLRLL